MCACAILGGVHVLLSMRRLLMLSTTSVTSLKFLLYGKSCIFYFLFHLVGMAGSRALALLRTTSSVMADLVVLC